MTPNEIKDLISQVSCEGYEFHVITDQHGTYLCATYLEADIISGEPSTQKTRKWYLSQHAVKSEIVQTALKCILTSVEHRVREHFLYRGERIFGPHFDVDALHEIAAAKRLDYRGRSEAKKQ